MFPFKKPTSWGKPFDAERRAVARCLAANGPLWGCSIQAVLGMTPGVFWDAVERASHLFHLPDGKGYALTSAARELLAADPEPLPAPTPNAHLLGREEDPPPKPRKRRGPKPAPKPEVPQAPKPRFGRTGDLIAAAIRRCGPVARSRLAEETGLSQIAVGNALAYWTAEGRFACVGRGEPPAGGGKRPALFGLSPG